MEAQLPLNQCWVHYQQLRRQEDDVLVSDADEDAFVYALKRLPELRRVTITPAAHGRLYSYPSTRYRWMIRALPYSFNYPIPRGWPTAADGEILPESQPWKRHIKISGVDSA